jgi:hypothetical protein
MLTIVQCRGRRYEQIEDKEKEEILFSEYPKWLIYVESKARFIFDTIKQTGCSWEKLDTNKRAFFTLLHSARIRAAQSFFLMEDTYSNEIHELHVKLIRELVGNGQLTWEELEFTCGELE